MVSPNECQASFRGSEACIKCLAYANAAFTTPRFRLSGSTWACCPNEHKVLDKVPFDVLGPEDPDTLASMNNLALAYKDRGEYAQAEALFSQTVEMVRQNNGPDPKS